MTNLKYTETYENNTGMSIDFYLGWARQNTCIKLTRTEHYRTQGMCVLNVSLNHHNLGKRRFRLL